MAVFGLDIPVVATLMMLASGQVECTLDQAPHIRVNPQTDDIAYNFNVTTEDLNRMKSDTISPYAPGTDSTTSGLRVDKPELTVEVSLRTAEYKELGMMCFSYDKIKVNIHLRPEIYLARDYNFKGCKEAVLEHEHKHVKVDREVMNKYAKLIGEDILAVVNKAGAMGPYPVSEAELVQQRMYDYISNAVMKQKLNLQEEMARRQKQVDSLEEYERVSAICDKAKRNRR